MASVNSRLEALETRAVRRRTQRRFKALKMPLNIVEFAMARRYLGEAIFPRQGTLLKLAAGQLDALTPYDHRVIAEWSAGFTRSLGSDNPSFVGSWGVQPDILDRIALMRERTGGGLEEFLAIIGRRGSKNFLGAILAADRLYRLCAIEDFTETFGIQRGKRLQIFVFAANRDQAIRNQLRDITNMVTHAPCFEGLVADASKGRLLLYTAAQRAARGDRLRPADALVEVLAAETTERAARGPAMPMAMFDEFAHVTGAGSTADSVDLYQAARPATRQFKGTGFVYQASSPWDRLGQLWISYNRGLALDPATGTALNPEIGLVQLCSWDPYTDWEHAPDIEAWPDGPTFPAKAEPVIAFDDYMARAEEANVESFGTEHRGLFRHSGIAYLKRDRIDAMFTGWKGRDLTNQSDGLLSISYAAHADPARSGDRFGYACGHLEDDDQGIPHVIFDEIAYWSPQDFPHHQVNYMDIDAELQDRIRRFKIGQFTFDQYNSAGSIDRLNDYGHRPDRSWTTDAYVRDATASMNWKMFETFKTALGHGLIHAPADPLLRAELEALQYDKGRVDHPHQGDIQTKDVVDCVVNVVWTLYGDNSQAIFDRLCATPVRGSQPAVLATPKTIAPPKTLATNKAAGSTANSPTTKSTS